MAKPKTSVKLSRKATAVARETSVVKLCSGQHSAATLDDQQLDELRNAVKSQIIVPVDQNLASFADQYVAENGNDYDSQEQFADHVYEVAKDTAHGESHQSCTYADEEEVAKDSNQDEYPEYEVEIFEEAANDSNHEMSLPVDEAFSGSAAESYSNDVIDDEATLALNISKDSSINDLLDHNQRSSLSTNYADLVSPLKAKIKAMKGNVSEYQLMIDQIKLHETKMQKEIAHLKLARQTSDQTIRVLVDRQKKFYQILVGNLRREIRRLKFGANSASDPLLEQKHFQCIPRTPYGVSAKKPTLGTIGNLPTNQSDYFALNPPPATGNHPESGNRWWWGDGPSPAKHFPSSTARPKTAPASNAPVPPNYLATRQNIRTFGSKTTRSTKSSDIKVGDRVSVVVGGCDAVGMVKYIGSFDPNPSSGIWCGLKLDRPIGKHNGVVEGKRYFRCEENHGFFAKLERVVGTHKKLRAMSTFE